MSQNLPAVPSQHPTRAVLSPGPTTLRLRNRRTRTRRGRHTPPPRTQPSPTRHTIPPTVRHAGTMPPDTLSPPPPSPPPSRHHPHHPRPRTPMTDSPAAALSATPVTAPAEPPARIRSCAQLSPQPPRQLFRAWSHLRLRLRLPVPTRARFPSGLPPRAGHWPWSLHLLEIWRLTRGRRMLRHGLRLRGLGCRILGLGVGGWRRRCRRCSPATRPISQLVRFTDEAVFADLNRRVRLLGLTTTATARGAKERSAVRSVHVCTPANGIAEIAAHIRHGDRSRAIALRMEIRRNRWICTALDLG